MVGTFRKILFLFILLICFGIFIPSTTHATDQRCFTRSACETVDVITGQSGTLYGPNSETIKACKVETVNFSGKDEDIGFCTSVGPAKTQVGFGGADEGKRSFENFGKFIQWIYRYGIMIAGVLAMTMIVVAGLQWVTSAGSPERITQAKKRIGDALMGLFVAVVSFFILNTVNPYLVNLRLPQVWKVNNIGIVPEYCNEVQGKKASKLETGPFTILPKETVCGVKYFIEGGGDSTCKGLTCNDSVCLSSGAQDPKTKEEIYECKAGILGGSIGTPRALMCDDLSYDIFDNNLDLWAVCKDTNWKKNLEKIDHLDLSPGAKQYIFGPEVKTKIQKACSTSGGVVGFYLGGEINDEQGNIGSLVPFCPANWLSSGVDDWFAIGRLPGSHKCNMNLAKVAFKYFMSREPDCENQGPKECSCGTLSHADVVKKIINSKDYVSYLFSQDELLSGLVCDIFISRNEFPPLDNTTLWNNVQFETNCDFQQTILDIGGLWKTSSLLE
ncbi:MAG: hypothetical protein HOA57_04685 [Candidatus Magasanikbacteria bacterium]|jgi:hypothetical protein|nr:hypothetical protein [Candidatus Magasanikbacteria bacterium]MBT4314863.1 hypothetical protein [Candidatus Magasanikbacteria bacterium]MBT4546750.1 hypothetical protein [Candidatus Magasanikbacteria bacterium]MBT6819641.1 hypothetical protein [Candidatus Magasanikbacteria bacterium]